MSETDEASKFQGAIGVGQDYINAGGIGRHELERILDKEEPNMSPATLDHVLSCITIHNGNDARSLAYDAMEDVRCAADAIKYYEACSADHNYGYDCVKNPEGLSDS